MTKGEIREGEFVIIGSSSDLTDVIVPGKRDKYFEDVERYWLVGLVVEVVNDYERDSWGVLKGGSLGKHLMSKMLYRTNKGVYYNGGNRRIYLDKDKEKELEEFIERLSDSDWDSQ